MKTSTLLIRVDKSHLITIGERLYTERIELIRELVNNAYDADATEVQVTIAEDEIRVADNGLGMDLEGLREYFTIGTPDKRLNPRSPRFGRLRIGQFGIGKFATLSACEQFTVRTQRGPFAAEVIFDKEEWERDGNRWDLPLRLLPPDSERGEGTTVTLSRLRRRFNPAEVERHLLDSVPLRAPDFAVFLNGRRLVPLHLPGYRIPILEGTPYGPIHGEIVIVPAHLASTLDMGVEIKVRQVTVRRELFGMETWGKRGPGLKARSMPTSSRLPQIGPGLSETATNTELSSTRCTVSLRKPSAPWAACPIARKDSAPVRRCVRRSAASSGRWQGTRICRPSGRSHWPRPNRRRPAEAVSSPTRSGAMRRCCPFRVCRKRRLPRLRIRRPHLPRHNWPNLANASRACGSSRPMRSSIGCG